MVSSHVCVIAVLAVAILSMAYTSYITTRVLREYLDRITDVVADNKQLIKLLETLIKRGVG